jgi:hypothetical protein
MAGLAMRLEQRLDVFVKRNRPGASGGESRASEQRQRETEPSSHALHYTRVSLGCFVGDWISLSGIGPRTISTFSPLTRESEHPAEGLNRTVELVRKCGGIAAREMRRCPSPT